MAIWAFVPLLLLMTSCQAGLNRGTPPSLAPVLHEGQAASILGRYIVVFKENRERRAGARSAGDPAALARSEEAQRLVRRLGGQVIFVYTAALVGFSAELSPAALAAVRAAPGVAWIEADQEAAPAAVPAGLDRTDQRLLPLDTQYAYNQTGAGVHAYVIDTGIRVTHAEFEGRAFPGFTTVNDGLGSDDCTGHGTHVAGTIGGKTWGIAKQVFLHAVRVVDCNSSASTSTITAGVDWVTQYGIHPAVANISLRVAGQSFTLSWALGNSITSGVTYVVAAGNDTYLACQTSPAHVQAVITVANVDQTNDTRRANSNYGYCVDIFAPGVDVESAALNTPSTISSGTSMSAPHVTGVAAFVLEDDPTASPAAVWAAILNAANVSTTPGWGGVINRDPTDPNVMLHWGSGSSDGYMDGDPHLMTVDGVRYDLQGAGEYVYLRNAGGFEIQIRHTPLATTARGAPDPYDGLSTCVSLNTAVAARVGAHRVTFQQDLGGPPTSDPSSLQMRVDGVLTPLTPQGVNLGGGLVRRSSANGMEIHFADGAVLLVTPGWFASHNLWWLSVDLLHTGARQGLLGRIAPGSWLPRLPNGASVGPMPSSLPQRYAILYGQFAEAWRVGDAASLFDYRPGMSTASFTNRNWPTLTGQCNVPRSTTPPSRPALPLVARQACLRVEDRHRRGACMFDVQATGETGFARTYLQSQEIRARLVNLFSQDRQEEPRDPDDLPD